MNGALKLDKLYNVYLISIFMVSNKKEGIINLISRDLSAIVLVISNLIVVIYGIIQKWNFSDYFLTFIIQSFIISFFFFFKMIFYKNLYYKDFSKNGKKTRVNLIGRVISSIFVLLIFGFFNFIYLVFISPLLLMSDMISLDSLSIPLIQILIFFGNHLFSFIYNFRRDSNDEKDYLNLVYLLILRIVPIHISIILWGGLILIGGFITVTFFGVQSNFSNVFGILSQIAGIIFLLLKIYLDFKTHNLEHKLDERNYNS
jgi:hypothetical protein